MNRHTRNQVLVNGALMALGALAIIGNVIAHWLIGIHQAMPGPYAFVVEFGFVAGGALVLSLGSWREWQARRSDNRGTGAS